MGRAKEKIDEKKLRSWKLLDDFRQRLAKAHGAMPLPPEKRPGGPERLLLAENYFSLMLFGLFNPLLDSMRGLCAARDGEQGAECGFWFHDLWSLCGFGGLLLVGNTPS